MARMMVMMAVTIFAIITNFTMMLLGIEVYDVREYAAPYAYIDV